MSHMPKVIKHLDELEKFELLVAAFPEKYAKREEEGDDIWDEVMEFWDELTNDPEQVEDFVARLVYLTMPMASAISGTHRHVLGVPALHQGSVNMTVAVSRDVQFSKEAQA